MNFFVLFTTKLNVSLVFNTVHAVLPPEKLSRVMSEEGSGGKGEALVRALVLHRCGLGSSHIWVRAVKFRKRNN